jgi:hypothetical protein
MPQDISDLRASRCPTFAPCALFFCDILVLFVLFNMLFVLILILVLTLVLILVLILIFIIVGSGALGMLALAV